MSWARDFRFDGIEEMLFETGVNAVDDFADLLVVAWVRC